MTVLVLINQKPWYLIFGLFFEIKLFLFKVGFAIRGEFENFKMELASEDVNALQYYMSWKYYGNFSWPDNGYIAYSEQLGLFVVDTRKSYYTEKKSRSEFAPILHWACINGIIIND